MAMLACKRQVVKGVNNQGMLMSGEAGSKRNYAHRHGERTVQTGGRNGGKGHSRRRHSQVIFPDGERKERKAAQRGKKKLIFGREHSEDAAFWKSERWSAKEEYES